MTGQRFRLKTATIAVRNGPEKRTAVQLPEGAQIVVLGHIQHDGDLDGNRQVNVEWDGTVVSMFLVDIHEKGEPMPPAPERKAVSKP